MCITTGYSLYADQPCQRKGYQKAAGTDPVINRKEQDMAITVNLYYTGVNGAAQKFAQEMKVAGVVDKIRKESGNLRYEYFVPVEDPETILLIDSWEDQEAIDKHHASPMMAELAALREKYDLHMKAERYVSDEEGFSDKDVAFLRR